MIDGQIYRVALGSSDAITLDQLASARVPPCCARITRDGRTGWCVLEGGHDGDHAPVLSTPPAPVVYGPRSRT